MKVLLGKRKKPVPLTKNINQIKTESEAGKAQGKTILT
jgi:hypothetical protein